MKKKLSVLIVDDNEDFCILLTTLLKKYCNNIANCSTVEEGLSKCAAVKPDILFLDNKLPDGWGWKMVNEFKKNASFIFLITGLTFVNKLALNQTDIQILPKPFDVTDMKLILKERFAEAFS